MRTKYLPAVDLMAPGLMTALYDGNLRLQPGQWIDCGGRNLSRFIGATKHVIYALHNNTTNKEAIQQMRGVFLKNSKTCHLK
jgi:hypothetical protein